MGKRIVNHDIILDDTASRIGGVDANKKVVSLDTATYPSLAELAHVKGATSSLQTQLTAKLNLDSWVADANTWTYSSADDPTFIASVNADMTGILTVGMRIRLVQSATTKYFIITAVGSFSAGATLITLYGGTDYDLANSAITLPYYSSGKVPFDFPITPAKWEVLVTDTAARSTASPTATVWYNTGTETIVLPIGVWLVMVKGTMFQNGIANDLAMTLSTANNSESDAKNTIKAAVAASGVNSIPIHLMVRIPVAAKTTYYLNLKTDASLVTSIGWQNGTYGTLVISAVNAYL